MITWHFHLADVLDRRNEARRARGKIILVRQRCVLQKLRKGDVDLVQLLVREYDAGMAGTTRRTGVGVIAALPTEQRQQLAESVLGSPDQRTRQVLWYIVIWTMAAAIFVFGAMAFVLIYQRKPAEAPLALATTALGGVVGLVATSPGSGRSD